MKTAAPKLISTTTKTLTESQKRTMRGSRYQRGSFADTVRAAAWASSRNAGEPMVVAITAYGYSIVHSTSGIPAGFRFYEVECNGTTLTVRQFNN